MAKPEIGSRRPQWIQDIDEPTATLRDLRDPVSRAFRFDAETRLTRRGWSGLFNRFIRDFRGRHEWLPVLHNKRVAARERGRGVAMLSVACRPFGGGKPAF
jgi:hypothetical protein